MGDLPFAMMNGGDPYVVRRLPTDVLISVPGAETLFQVSDPVPGQGTWAGGTAWMARGFVTIDNRNGTAPVNLRLGWGTPTISAEQFSYDATIPPGAMLPLPIVFDVKVVPGIAHNEFFVRIWNRGSQAFMVNRSSLLSTFQWALEP